MGRDCGPPGRGNLMIVSAQAGAAASPRAARPAWPRKERRDVRAQSGDIPGRATLVMQKFQLKLLADAVFVVWLGPTSTKWPPVQAQSATVSGTWQAATASWTAARARGETKSSTPQTRLIQS